MSGDVRPQGPLVWIHGASVGEVLAAVGLIERLRALNLRILLTSGTVTSAAIVAKRFPPDVIHQYVPYDSPRYVARFLDHWHPSLALFIVMPIILGTRILSPWNVIAAMAVYTVALLVRTVADALDAVPTPVTQAQAPASTDPTDESAAGQPGADSDAGPEDRTSGAPTEAPGAATPERPRTQVRLGPPSDHETAEITPLVGDDGDDVDGRQVSGGQPEAVTEVWTFVRQRGGNWELSAIQQTN